MASKGAFQRPSEPLGASFGYRPYFRTLLNVFFCHLGSTLASHGGPFWKPFGLLFLSWGAPRAQNGRILGGLLSASFFERFLVLFWVGLGPQKRWFGSRGVSKIKVSAKSFFWPFGGPFWGPFWTQNGPQISSWLILESLCDHLGPLEGGYLFLIVFW